MSRNVEIKAKVDDHQSLVEKAANISGTQPVTLKQHDIFYNAPEGRLKLRSVEEDGVARTELIWYNRPDATGPKVSDYSKFDVPSDIIEPLKGCLAGAMGTKGEVKKERKLVILDRTRIHIDRVEGLGDFMELEVCLKPEETPEEGDQTAKKIMEQLGIKETDLLSGAYMDMLNK